ncbi:MAG: glycine cleavage system aminomethyltransferase GcvT [Desulfovibrionaceae bacterium]
MEQLRTTPLTAWHRAKGAKMAPFAGFDMPVQYTSILAEHEHTRTKAAIFDICHMGEFRLRGKGAKDALNAALSHDLDTLAPGKCRYGFLLGDSGGVVDDMIVYCMELGETDEYMIVVNGACEQKDYDRIASLLPAGFELENISEQTAKIDLQGPLSLDVLHDVLGGSWSHLKFFNFGHGEYAGAPLIVSRTGYTGELGYELYLPSEKALELWEALAADARVLPVGLGARDTLRLECGFPLYGQDLDDEHTPVEAGYGWLMKKQTPYAGREGAMAVRESLVALSIEGRRPARHHDLVLDEAGNEVGRVTSGSFAPSLGHAVALAYVRADAAKAASFTIRTARAELPAVRAELPFFREGTIRMKTE